MHADIEMEDARDLQSVHLLPAPGAVSSSAASGGAASAGNSSARRSSNVSRSDSASPGGSVHIHQPPSPLPFSDVQRRKMMNYTMLCLMLVVVIGLLALLFGAKFSRDTDSGGGDSLADCLAKHRPPNLSVKQPLSPRAAAAAAAAALPPPVFITHANVWTGVGDLLTDADVLLQYGKVSQVSPASGVRLQPPQDPTLITIDGGQNAFVTPGLIDLHSHAGLGAYPLDLWANDDVNEMTSPTFPQLRAVDALDPRDPAFPLVLAGGITTSQLMPGSGDAMGGEGCLVKNRGGGTVQDMLLPRAPRLMKMACGENVKRVFGKEKGVTPMSRLGSAWVMRQRFQQASDLRAQQDMWCSALSADEQARLPFPNQREHESLAALLRGEIRLNTHCYLTQDFEMMLRLSQEFNFKITTFHHALSAWRIADVLAEQGINVATFSDLGLYKEEAYDASVSAPSVLNTAGVRVILKSDHPVTPSQWLMWEAAKAAHYGLPARAAIGAVTSAPAAAAGVDDHLGALIAGYDADVVVWDRDPLVLGARASAVLLDGAVMVNNLPAAGFPSHPTSATRLPDMTAEGPTQVCGFYNDSNTVLNDVYKVVDLMCYAIVLEGGMIYSPAPIDGATSSAVMIVDNGNVSCIGLQTDCPLPPPARNCVIFRQQQGILIPGLIESGSHIGQFDISAEDATGDGSLSGSSAGADFAPISTLDGLRFHSRHMRAAWSAGITTLVARPVSSLLVSGLSSAVRTCCGNSLLGLDADDPVIVKDRLGLHVVVGNAAKGGGASATVSGQFHSLRALFEQAAARLNTSGSDFAPSPSSAWPRADPLTPFGEVLAGRKGLFVEAAHADAILSAVRLQRDYGFQLNIVGGAEAHLVADALAETTPPTKVILFSRTLPSTSETARAVAHSMALLAAAQVPVALSTGDTDNARLLRFEVGWNREAALAYTAAQSPPKANALAEQALVESVTVNVAQMFNLPAGTGTLARGQRAEFALFNGSPWSLQSDVQLVGSGDQVDCRPKQR